MVEGGNLWPQKGGREKQYCVMIDKFVSYRGHGIYIVDIVINGMWVKNSQGTWAVLTNSIQKTIDSYKSIVKRMLLR